MIQSTFLDILYCQKMTAREEIIIFYYYETSYKYFALNVNALNNVKETEAPDKLDITY